MPASTRPSLAALRAEIAALERSGGERAAGEVIAFGDARLDGRLPGGGVALKSWHAFAGEGLDIETAAASAAFVARLARPLAARGELVWVLRRDDLYAPGLVDLGLPAERLIQVCARNEDEALAVIEDALRTPGVAAVFGEVDEVDLVAGRRLQLACEQARATGFMLRRRPYGGAGKGETGAAAATRWTIAPSPSEPASGVPGLGAPRWRVTLERCRGGRTGAWILEGREEDDATHPFRLVADLGDCDLAPEESLRLAG
ncbi:MAG TPA: protein imuA [Caulobacteraceae bacterium]|jgi:protein ImuA|nr:protein imuA [Caulobacteraceae bacterium]